MYKILSYISNWIESQKEILLLRMCGLHVECSKVTSREVWISHWAEDGDKIYLHYSPEFGWNYKIEN